MTRERMYFQGFILNLGIKTKLPNNKDKINARN